MNLINLTKHFHFVLRGNATPTAPGITSASSSTTTTASSPAVLKDVLKLLPSVATTTTTSTAAAPVKSPKKYTLIYDGNKPTEFFILSEGATQYEALNATEIQSAKTSGASLKSSYDSNNSTGGNAASNTVYAWEINDAILEQLIKQDTINKREALLQPVGYTTQCLAQFYQILKGASKKYTEDNARILTETCGAILAAEHAINQGKAATKHNAKDFHATKVMAASMVFELWLAELARVIIDNIEGTGEVGIAFFQTFMLPWFIGYAASKMHYALQVADYREKNGGVEPSDAIKEQFKKDSVWVAWQVRGLLCGWQIGWHLFSKGMLAADPSGSTMAAVGFIVGSCAACLLLVAVVAKMKAKEPGKDVTTIITEHAGELFMLVIAVTLAGAAYFFLSGWDWIISSLPGLHDNITAAAFLDFMMQGLTIYPVVASILNIVPSSRSESWEEFKNTNIYNKFLPVPLQSAQGAKEQFEDRQALALAAALKI